MAITVLIADDVTETRESVRRLLSLDNDIMVIGEAADGKQAVGETARLNPDIVLMDINMPVMDGISATEEIGCSFRSSSVIMMSVQDENEYLKKAMLAGARDYIIKPFSNDELVDTIKRVYQMDRERKSAMKEKTSDGEATVISFFGTKGGVGKTTLAVNTAIALKQRTKASVVLVDLDLQFGDVAASMNIIPRQSIADLVREPGEMDIELIEGYLLPHKPSGVKVLCAPLKPEHAEIVSQAHTEQILNILKKHYSFVIIDTASHFSESVLTALEMSSKILMITALDLLTVKNTKMALHIMESLNMRDRAELVLNRADESMGMKSEDLERALGQKIRCALHSNGRTAVSAINKGVPLILTHPNSNLGEGIYELAGKLMKNEAPGRKRHSMLAGMTGIFS